jgi:predicted DNA-binding transcriptional regulator AlpA
MPIIEKLAVGAGAAADLFDISRPTFLKWSRLPGFPRPIKTGGTVRYLVSDLERWAEQQKERGGDVV